MKWVYDDGGRSLYYKGDAGDGDCVVRSIAIATELSYREVYNEIKARARTERTRIGYRKSSPRDGVQRWTYQPYLEELGWEWVSCKCQVHLRENELPSGRLVVRLSKHMTAVVDGTIHDTFDPSRGGTRCVYGYFRRSC